MSTTTSRRLGRTAAGIAAASLGLTAMAVSPVHADTVAAGSASATVADVVSSGNAIHIDGTGWTTPAGTHGSTIGVKLGDALGTEPAAGPVTNPATGTSADTFDVWAAVAADDDGSFSADIPFPTPTNTKPALESAWAVGTTHTLRLLTGSMDSADTPRSALLTFTVGEGLVSTATTAASGEVTVAFSGGQFKAGEVLSVAQGATARQWTTTSGRTSTVADTLTVPSSGAIAAKVVLPAGAARAGDVTLTITGDQGTHQDVIVQAPPSVVFDKGTGLGTSGTLTLGNLVEGAQIASVKLGDTVLATGLTAGASGTATASYSIPAGITPVTYPLVVTQTAPSARTYTLTQALYPDESAVGAHRFEVSSTSSDQQFYQGFYQSAYSKKENALYVTAPDRGTGNGGFIYKLDADTLQVKAQVETKDHDGFTKTGAFGITVDDVHGNVWVGNTGSNSVAVYKAGDLSLVKQFEAGTVSHARDVVFDPATNRIFVSSASEGSSATSTGYISAFDATAPYEKIDDIETGTRDVFNPVSLAFGSGKVFSPSLGSNKVVSIDTTTLKPTFLTINGIDVGGRGASGIAYDAADNRLFIASQNSNEVVIADATTGATIKEVPTGKQALNVAYDATTKLVYVANFGGTSVSVLDVDGNKVGSLPIATANHVSLDGKGGAFAVDKASPNKVWKIQPRLNAAGRLAVETIGGTEIVNPVKAGVTGDEKTTPLTVNATVGQPIHLSGTNFLTANGTSGSVISVKPASVQGSPTIATIGADASGSWNADIAFPAGWTVGDTQHLRLLTGSGKEGDVTRSIAVKVHVGAASTGNPPATTPVPTAKDKAAQAVTKDKAKVKKLKKKLKKAHGVKAAKLKKKLAKAKKQLTKDKKKLHKLK